MGAVQPDYEVATVASYSTLAALIATSGEAGMSLPLALALLIRRTLRLRQDQAEKYPDTQSNKGGNAGHRHFDNELQSTLCSWSRRYPA